MDIDEIAKVYSAYGLDSTQPNKAPHLMESDIPLFPYRIKPPSAFIKSEQSASNVSILKGM